MKTAPLGFAPGQHHRKSLLRQQVGEITIVFGPPPPSREPAWVNHHPLRRFDAPSSLPIGTLSLGEPERRRDHGQGRQPKPLEHLHVAFGLMLLKTASVLMNPAIRQDTLPSKARCHPKRDPRPPGRPHQSAKRLKKNDRINPICIATTFDINYALGGATMMKSVKRHTKCDGVVFKIITSDPEVVRRFGAENCHFVDEAIKAKYGNVKYSPELPKERYHTSWYRFEIFSFEGFDRVICNDSDCICMEDISFLFSEELDSYDLVSVEDHIVSKCFTKNVPQLESQGLRFDGLKRRLQVGQIDVQPALLVANKSIVYKAWYEKLLQFANARGFNYSIDEGIG